MKKINERLKILREELFGKRGMAAFARKIGVPEATYRKYEYGTTIPAEVLAEIAKNTDTNIRWLLNGEGEWEVRAKERPPDRVRLLSITAKGGFGKTRKRPIEIEVVREIPNTKNLRGKDLVALMISGDSMATILPGGTFAVCDRKGKPAFGQPVVYIMKNTHEIQCKLYTRSGNKYIFYDQQNVVTEVGVKYVDWLWPVVGTL